MKNLAFLLLFISFLVPHFVFSAELGDAMYLRKLSLSLRGIPPEQEEFRNLLSSNDPQLRAEFLRQAVNRYLASQEYQARMVFRLSETFEVRTPSLPFWLPLPENSQYQMQNNLDSMTELFKRIAEKNLSWDELLTAHDYLAYRLPPNAFAVSDIGFFLPIVPELPFDGNGTIAPGHGPLIPTDKLLENYPVHFAPDDLRVSGVLTTSRFFSRYTTTGVNKNRRRAAAVFRIFLCDAMVPAIQSGTDKFHEFLDATFPQTFEVTIEQIHAGLTANERTRHGTDKDCMACHSKLDPMGRVFQNIGNVMSGDLSSGHLTYPRGANGEIVEVPLKGIGDLGKAIAQQPEYLDCQVSWFWKQFIGSEVALPSEKRKEWVRKFESVGRRANDFISLLVAAPEFKSPPINTDVITFDRVEASLKRCDTCHSKDEDIPKFAVFPIGGTKASHIEWIADMRTRVNLPDGDKKKMPKGAADWTPAEIELLKKWLDQGAPDEHGQPTAPTPASSFAESGGGQ